MNKRSLLLCSAMFVTALIANAQVPANFKGDLLSPVQFAAGTYPVSAATGDLNQDGKVDVVVANSQDGTIGVYLGNGDGTLGTPSSIALPTGSFPWAVALADLNGDGKLDIVEADYNINNLVSGGAIRVFLGNGDGTFQPVVSYVAGKNLTSLVVADFNGDGKPDVAAVDNRTGSVSVLLNDGTGKLQAPVSYATGDGSYAMAAADFRKAGKIDLVVTISCSFGGGDPTQCDTQKDGTIAVLLGNGDGTFQTAVSYPAGPTPFKVVTADFNGDGFPDVAVTNTGLNSTGLGSGFNDTVAVFLGKGDGTLLPFVLYPVGDTPLDISSGDFNGDGKADLMVASGRNGGLVVELLGNGDGTFAGGVNYFSALNGNIAPVCLQAADLNGDGHPDLIACTAFSTNISVLLNAFGKTRQAVSVTLSADTNPAAVFFGTGLTAAVVSNGSPVNSGNITIYGNGQGLDLGNGLVDVTPSMHWRPTTPGMYNLVAIYSGDTLFEGATSSVVQEQIILIPTNTGLTSNLNPSSVGKAVTFTAISYNITVGSPVPSPTGSTSFFDGTTLIGTMPVGVTHPVETTPPGQFIFSGLAAGPHTITAVYPGDANFAASTSPVLIQQVGASPLVISTSSATATINAGQAATYALTLASFGFSGSVNIMCSGAPANSSCTVNPSTTGLNTGTTMPFTVSVATQARSATIGFFPGNSTGTWAVGAFALAGLFALMWLQHRIGAERLRRFALITAAGLIVVLALGCGGGTAGSPRGTSAGTYTIVVTAVSGATSTSQNLSLTVN